jgi:hypothetical protein
MITRPDGGDGQEALFLAAEGSGVLMVIEDNFALNPMTPGSVQILQKVQLP